MWGNHIAAWNLVAWCNVPWGGSLFEMATLSQCSHFLISVSQGAVILWMSCHCHIPQSKVTMQHMPWTDYWTAVHSQIWYMHNLYNFLFFFGVGGAVRFLVVGTIGQEERPPRGQLWMEQCLTSLKCWPILYTIWADPNYTWGLAILADSLLFSCDQAALQMVFSVCPSVRPSVRLSVTPFWLRSHHRIITKFSGVITNDQRKVHAKGQGQRSKVKVTEVTTQLNRFRTVTPVWIHIWWWNDAYSLMLLRRGALLLFKVIRQISRSHGSKNRLIWPRLGVSGL